MAELQKGEKVRILVCSMSFCKAIIYMENMISFLGLPGVENTLIDKV